jgi:hypothetical protein
MRVDKSGHHNEVSHIVKCILRRDLMSGHNIDYPFFPYENGGRPDSIGGHDPRTTDGKGLVVHYREQQFQLVTVADV